MQTSLTRRGALRVTIFLLAVIVSPLRAQDAVARQKLPNILWLVAEDLSPRLGSFGDAFAKTPNLDRLAAEGVRYTNAFSNAPVCAPSRCTLITGIYASSLGTHQMRSRYDIPADVRLFFQYLQEAGYYCMNPGKTDYNIGNPPGGGDKAAWDAGADWDAPGRKEGQPFFLVRNFETTHESCLHGMTLREADLNVPGVKLPPYYPDVPIFRSLQVQYYERIAALDAQIGSWLDRLEKDGLAADTIVFFYGDHGGVMPRGKRFLYDSGTRVPLIIRVPEKYKHLAPAAPGVAIDRLVSFVDFAPTLLNLAGVKKPGVMQGLAFLGPDQPPERERVFGFRARMDERYDLFYTLRDKQYRYVRNFMPHRPHFQHLSYLWKTPAVPSWEAEFKAGRCNPAQSAVWIEKPSEELFDVATDPDNVTNLADDPGRRAVLERMRTQLKGDLLAQRDVALLPESDMVARSQAFGAATRVWAADDAKYPIAKILDAADVASRRDEESVPRLIELTRDADAAVRYWAAVGFAVRRAQSPEALAALEPLLKDESPAVRVAAAEALSRSGKADAGLPALVAELDRPGGDVLLALNALEALGPIAQPVAEQLAAKASSLTGEYPPRVLESLLPMLGQASLEPAPKRPAKRKKPAQ